jgi:hypothetical protein
MTLYRIIDEQFMCKLVKYVHNTNSAHLSKSSTTMRVWYDDSTFVMTYSRNRIETFQAAPKEMQELIDKHCILIGILHSVKLTSVQITDMLQVLKDTTLNLNNYEDILDLRFELEALLKGNKANTSYTVDDMLSLTLNEANYLYSKCKEDLVPRSRDYDACYSVRNKLFALRNTLSGR